MDRLRRLQRVRLRYFPLIFVILNILTLQNTHAETDTGSGVWFSYSARGRFAGDLRAFIDLQPRFVIDSPKSKLDSSISAANFRGAFGYQIDPNFSAYLGYAFVPSYNPKREETRMFQDVWVVHFFEDLKFSNRLRLEERNLEGVDKISLRGRYQSRVQKLVGSVEGLSLVFSDELFFNLNDVNTTAPHGFEQNRAFLGVNYQLSKSLAIDLGYLNQFQEKRQGSADNLNHIILLELVQTFDWSN